MTLDKKYCMQILKLIMVFKYQTFSFDTCAWFSYQVLRLLHGVIEAYYSFKYQNFSFDTYT